MSQNEKPDKRWIAFSIMDRALGDIPLWVNVPAWCFTYVLSPITTQRHVGRIDGVVDEPSGPGIYDKKYNF